MHGAQKQAFTAYIGVAVYKIYLSPVGTCIICWPYIRSDRELVKLSTTAFSLVPLWLEQSLKISVPFSILFYLFVTLQVIKKDFYTLMKKNVTDFNYNYFTVNL